MLTGLERLRDCACLSSNLSLIVETEAPIHESTTATRQDTPASKDTAKAVL